MPQATRPAARDPALAIKALCLTPLDKGCTLPCATHCPQPHLLLLLLLLLLIQLHLDRGWLPIWMVKGSTCTGQGDAVSGVHGTS
jgi:hypothetical protein